MSTRFPVLRAFSLCLRILGWIVFILAVVGFIVIEAMLLLGSSAIAQIGGGLFFSGCFLTTQVIPFALLIGGVVNAFGMFASSEWIDLQLGIEENTRATQLVLRRRLGEPSEYPAPPPSMWERD